MRLAFVLSLFALLLASCGSDQPKLDPNLDAEALLAQSSIEMNALDSYHVRFSVPAHPEDVREEHRWEFDFVQPDDFRYLLYHAEGVQKEVCETHGQGRTCTFILTSITERSRYEVLYVSEFSYWRQCDGKGDNCDDWEREARPELPMIGPSPTSWPQWPIVALEMIDQPEPVEIERMSGVETVRIRGTLNMIRAVFENQRRVLEALGITAFGTECGVYDVQMNTEGSFPSTQPGPTATCRDVSFEETLAEHDDSIAFQDENPATIDVWISPEDGRLHRLTIAGPVEDSGEPSIIEFTIDYSEFNSVSLTAPEIEEDPE